MRFEGKTALVTGGTRGIGLAIADRLRAEGATVYAWGSKVVDITDPLAVGDAIDRMGSGIDILVNNAGVFGPVKSALSYTRSEWDAVMEVNLTSQYAMCRAVVPGMVKRRYGRVVNLASVVGKDVNPMAPAYSVAKAGVIAFTKCLGRELAKSGVTVNCVTPSAVNTDLFKDTPGEQIAIMLKKVPMERFVTVDEVAALVCWLASEEASASTAAVFDISGGRAQY